MATDKKKKEVKVRDLKPSKDAKGGGGGGRTSGGGGRLSGGGGRLSGGGGKLQ